MSASRTTGTITAAGSSVSFTPSGPFKFYLTGTWVATCYLRSTQDGTNYDQESDLYTSNTTGAVYVPALKGLGTYQIYCSAFTSGIIQVTFSEA